jgi:hypothetical protein
MHGTWTMVHYGMVCVYPKLLLCVMLYITQETGLLGEVAESRTRNGENWKRKTCLEL